MSIEDKVSALAVDVHLAVLSSAYDFSYTMLVEEGESGGWVQLAVDSQWAGPDDPDGMNRTATVEAAMPVGGWPPGGRERLVRIGYEVDDEHEKASRPYWVQRYQQGDQYPNPDEDDVWMMVGQMLNLLQNVYGLNESALLSLSVQG